MPCNMTRNEAQAAFGNPAVYLEKLPREAAPHRDPGARRRAQERRLPGRARLLDAAPPPEDHRGGAGARARREAARAHRRALRRRLPQDRLPRRRHLRVPVRGRRVLLHRDEHPHPGRAPGDRDDHRASTWCRSRSASPPARSCAFGRRTSCCAATPSSAASTPRIRTASRPRRGASPPTIRRAARASASTRTSTPGYTVPPNYDSMIGKVIAYGATREQAIRAHAHRALGDGGRGHPDQHPAAPRAAARQRFLRGGTSIHYLEQKLAQESKKKGSSALARAHAGSRGGAGRGLSATRCWRRARSRCGSSDARARRGRSLHALLAAAMPTPAALLAARGRGRRPRRDAGLPARARRRRGLGAALAGAVRAALRSASACGSCRAGTSRPRAAAGGGAPRPRHSPSAPAAIPRTRLVLRLPRADPARRGERARLRLRLGYIGDRRREARRRASRRGRRRSAGARDDRRDNARANGVALRVAPPEALPAGALRRRRLQHPCPAADRCSHRCSPRVPHAAGGSRSRESSSRRPPRWRAAYAARLRHDACRPKRAGRCSRACAGEPRHALPRLRHGVSRAAGPALRTRRQGALRQVRLGIRRRGGAGGGGRRAPRAGALAPARAVRSLAPPGSCGGGRGRTAAGVPGRAGCAAAALELAVGARSRSSPCSRSSRRRRTTSAPSSRRPLPAARSHARRGVPAARLRAAAAAPARPDEHRILRPAGRSAPPGHHRAERRAAQPRALSPRTIRRSSSPSPTSATRRCCAACCAPRDYLDAARAAQLLAQGIAPGGEASLRVHLDSSRSPRHRLSPLPFLSLVKILVTGSIAYDTIMVFPDRFRNHLLADQLHILNVCFLTPEMRREFGGTAGNIAYNLKLLGERAARDGHRGRGHRSPTWRAWSSWAWAPSTCSALPGQFTAQAFITTDLDDNQITAFHPGRDELLAREPCRAASSAPDSPIIAPDGKQGMLQHARECAEARHPVRVRPGAGTADVLRRGAARVRAPRRLRRGERLRGQAAARRRPAARLEDLARELKALVVTLGAEGSRHPRRRSTPRDSRAFAAEARRRSDRLRRRLPRGPALRHRAGLGLADHRADWARSWARSRSRTAARRTTRPRARRSKRASSALSATRPGKDEFVRTAIAVAALAALLAGCQTREVGQRLRQARSGTRADGALCHRRCGTQGDDPGQPVGPGRRRGRRGGRRRGQRRGRGQGLDGRRGARRRRRRRRRQTPSRTG